MTDGSELVELERQELGKYTTILYIYSDGPQEDPASTIEQRLAVFFTGEEPAEIETVAKSSYSWFEGLNGAILDDSLDKLQERDHDAERHRQESESFLRAAQDKSQYSYGRPDGQQYEKFLEAIDRVAKNEEDEEAWTIIDHWRERQLRGEERSSRL
jgi:hypothetical protein